MPMSRRRIVQLSAGTSVGVALASSGVASGSSSGSAGPRALPSRNALFASLRGAPRGQPGLWWFSGALWGKRSLDAAVMLFAVEGFSFNRLVLQPDQSVQMEMIEIGFWLDPVSREPADSWVNPMNGLTCTPEHFMGPQSLRFDPAGVASTTMTLPPGMHFEGWINEPVVSGDLVWSGETLIVRSPAGPAASADPLQSGLPVFTATSLDTYQARLADLEDATDRWIPASRSYQTLGSWYPWMRMGHEAGGISFQIIGRKLASLDEMPAALRGLIDDRHPGWLARHGS